MKVSMLVVFTTLCLTMSVFAGGTKEKDKADSMTKSEDTMMKSDDKMMKSDDKMMKSDDKMMKSDAMMKSDFFDVSGLGKQVVGFTNEQAAWTLAQSQNVVYFFAASWCPGCQGAMKDIRSNFSQIPSNTTIVVVNYDKAADLKTKYGVSMQHTFVVVGSKGEKKKAWSGSFTVAEIVANATKM